VHRSSEGAGVGQLRKSMELFLRQKELEATGAEVDEDLQRQLYEQSLIEQQQRK